MNEECLICQAPLEYSNEGILMECAVCHKSELSKAACANGHYVCDECHAAGLDAIFGVCLSSRSNDPVEILEELMALPFCHMHGPEHHVLAGASLLTAYCNAGGGADLEASLREMRVRGSSVPGGACGFWGACGAGIGAGMFVSIVSHATPLDEEGFAAAHLMTARVLEDIGRIGGPRCCKRGSYLAVINAVSYCREQMGVNMKLPDRIACSHAAKNNQCIGKRCPFYGAGLTVETPNGE